MNSMEIYLAQEEVSQNKEKLINSSERKYGKGSKEKKGPRKINKELHTKIRGVKLKVHPNNLLEGHFITLCLKNLYFIRKQWQKVRKLLHMQKKGPGQTSQGSWEMREKNM